MQMIRALTFHGVAQNQLINQLIVQLQREAAAPTRQIHLRDRYSQTGAIPAIEEAIQLGQEAVNATPPDHPHRAGRLSNLGNRLGDRSSRTGAIADLEEAIRVGRESVHAYPPIYPAWARRLDGLGIPLRDRYSQTGAMVELEEARKYFIAALQHPSSAISVTIAAGRHQRK